MTSAKNLRLVFCPREERLFKMHVYRVVDLPTPAVELGAFRREEISSGKMRDLSKLFRVPSKELLHLAEAT
jgi:hypothetical protein